MAAESKILKLQQEIKTLQVTAFSLLLFVKGLALLPDPFFILDGGVVYLSWENVNYDDIIDYFSVWF